VANGRNCVFVAESDRRKKFALRRVENQLDTAQQVLDNIIAAFNTGDRPHLDNLLLAAREWRAGRARQDSVTFVGNAEQVWVLTRFIILLCANLSL
jgi:predicted lipid-binding transport protein (Tim44 family)